MTIIIMCSSNVFRDSFVYKNSNICLVGIFIRASKAVMISKILVKEFFFFRSKMCFWYSKDIKVILVNNINEWDLFECWSKPLIFKEPIFIEIEIIGEIDVWRREVLLVCIESGLCDKEEIVFIILELLALKKVESANDWETEYCKFVLIGKL